MKIKITIPWRQWNNAYLPNFVNLKKGDSHTYTSRDKQDKVNFDDVALVKRLSK